MALTAQLHDDLSRGPCFVDGDSPVDFLGNAGLLVFEDTNPRCGHAHVSDLTELELVILERGVTVDAAMRAFGLPMGPFEAQDLGGLDIAAFQRKAARERGETPFAPVADRLVALGRLGQKTRGGWYDYDEGSRTPKASPAVLEAIHLASKEAGITTGAFTPEQIQDAILLPMVNEGAKILAEGIALRAADIDLVKIHGYGFPRTKGGPMHWAKTVGDAARGFAPVHEALTALAARGLAAAPDEALLALR